MARPLSSRTTKYAKLSAHYLENAFHFLRAGDAEKAGEFLWGSMAQAMKAVAASRGIVLKSHRDVWTYAHELARDLGDANIYHGFRQANALHGNFYESRLRVQDVASSAESLRPVIATVLGLVPDRAA